MKKIIAVLSAAAICLAFASAAFAAGAPSAWAEKEVSEAVSLGFVLEGLQSDYTAPITREEFAQTAIFYLAASQHLSVNDFFDIYGKKYAALNGKPLETGNPFADTDHYFVGRAYALGIVNGRGGGVFDPDSPITRQEAAVMLNKTYRLFSNYAEQEEDGLFEEAFGDADTVADWAVESVLAMYKMGIMNGDGYNWNPLGDYTREQCFVTFLHLYKNGADRTPLMPYEEALKDATTTYDFLSLTIEEQLETAYCTILVRYIGGLPRGGETAILLLNKPGSPAGEGGFQYLPTPNSFSYAKAPDKIWLSGDETTLYYSYFYSEPLTELVSAEGDLEVIREAVMDVYTVDLATGIVTVTIEPLP